MIEIEKGHEAFTNFLGGWNKKKLDPKLTGVRTFHVNDIDASTWRAYTSRKHVDVLAQCVVANFENDGAYVVPLLDEKCNLQGLCECTSCEFAETVLTLESEVDLWELMVRNLSPQIVLFCFGMFFRESVYLHNNPLQCCCIVQPHTVTWS